MRTRFWCGRIRTTLPFLATLAAGLATKLTRSHCMFVLLTWHSVTPHRVYRKIPFLRSYGSHSFLVNKNYKSQPQISHVLHLRCDAPLSALSL